MSKLRLEGEQFIDVLKSPEMISWIQDLYDGNFIDKQERTLQLYIASYVLFSCFYKEGAIYHPRALKIEERPDSADSDIPDISLPNESYEKVDVWVEIKNHFKQEDLNSTEVEKIERDFKKANDSGALGVVMVALELEGCLDYITPILEKYPDVTLIPLLPRGH